MTLQNLKDLLEYLTPEALNQPLQLDDPVQGMLPLTFDITGPDHPSGENVPVFIEREQTFSVGFVTALRESLCFKD